jgi:hypothetical protein
MAAAGFGFPGDGARTRDPVARRLLRHLPARGRVSLLESPVLSLPGSINEKPPNEACSRAGDRSEPGVPTDRANHRAAAGADGRAGQRPLLSWGHIGASSDRQNDGREPIEDLIGNLSNPAELSNPVEAPAAVATDVGASPNPIQAAPAAGARVPLSPGGDSLLQITSHRRNERRNARQLAAEWCRRDFARGVRLDPS